MVPRKFKIQGSLGVLSGLGRDVLEVDLEELIPSDALTVAIVADNGGGKSTLLNLALTPWRNPPMLKGTLYDEFGPVGLRELEWWHAGDLYRSRIEIKQTDKTKAQKSYLHVRKTGDWFPVKLPDNTGSDGKNSTYDRCLEHILGPHALYYLSAFRAQGAPKLAEYSDPKQLMEDLLSLGSIRDLQKKAKDVIRDLNRVFLSEQARLGSMDEMEEKLSRIKESLESKQQDLDRVVIGREQTRKNIALLKREHEKLLEEGADDEILRKNREDFEKTMVRTEADVQKLMSQMEGEIRNANTRIQNLESSMKQEDESTANQVRQIQFRADKARSLIAKSDEIKDARLKLLDISKEIESEEARSIELQAQIDKLIVLENEIKVLNADMTKVRELGGVKAQKCESMRKRAGFIEVVPCHGEGEYAACPALQDAHEAKRMVPVEEQNLVSLRESWIEMNGKLSLRSREYRDAESAMPTMALVSLKSNVTNLRQRERELNEVAAQASGVTQARAILAESQDDIDSIKAKLDKTKSDAAKQIEAEEIEQEKTAVKLDKTRSNLIFTLKKMRDQLDAMPAPGDNTALQAAENKLRDAENRSRSLDRDESDLTTTVKTLSASIAEIRTQIETAGEELEKNQALGDSIANWKMLAVSLQGVIDLSIEDAGPSISAKANDLLTQAYGPRFSVRIVTQREQANGKLVETFDIFVMDSETGMESSILRKSGGEGVWLDKALTDAVGLFHQEASGMEYECLFADEAEDGLTAERKQMFYRMDRAALESGGYKRKFFVSHNPEAWSMADAVIRLDDWRV